MRINEGSSPEPTSIKDPTLEEISAPRESGAVRMEITFSSDANHWDMEEGIFEVLTQHGLLGTQYRYSACPAYCLDDVLKTANYRTSGAQEYFSNLRAEDYFFSFGMVVAPTGEFAFTENVDGRTILNYLDPVGLPDAMLIIVYDKNELCSPSALSVQGKISPLGDDDVECAFRDPNNKMKALLGVVEINYKS